MAAPQAFQKNGIHPPRRFTPLVAIDRERALLVFKDKIVLYDAALGASIILKKAGATSLGRFLEAPVWLDHGIWVAGENGVGRLSEFPAPNGWVFSEYTAENRAWTNFRHPIRRDAVGVAERIADGLGCNRSGTAAVQPRTGGIRAAPAS